LVFVNGLTLHASNLDLQINVGGNVSNIEDSSENNDDEVKNQLPLLRPSVIRLNLPEEPENPPSSSSTPVVTTADADGPGRISSW
jgi:hypothetical protein